MLGSAEPAQRKVPEDARPVRLLTLTTLFPNSRQPRHGIFVANRLRKLCESGRVQAEVIAAVPAFPGAYRYATEVPARETIDGFDVRHPRYFQIPGVGMRVQPDALARAIRREVRRGDTRAFDVVDAHFFYPDGVAAARVADELDLPLVISARGSDINLIGDIPFARERMLRAAERAQALIAVSEALADRMRAIGMPSERIHVLRNGVDTQMFRPMPKAEARARLGLDDRSQWVLCVGNLVSEKGLDVLVRAIGVLPKSSLDDHWRRSAQVGVGGTCAGVRTGQGGVSGQHAAGGTSCSLFGRRRARIALASGRLAQRVAGGDRVRNSRRRGGGRRCRGNHSSGRSGNDRGRAHAGGLARRTAASAGSNARTGACPRIRFPVRMGRYRESSVHALRGRGSRLAGTALARRWRPESFRMPDRAIVTTNYREHVGALEPPRILRRLLR